MTILIAVSLSSCQPYIRFSSEKTTTDSKNYPAAEKNTIYNSEKTTTPYLRIINEAKRWLGTPYCYGGASMKCTDCSGFVKEVYGKMGLQLPRTAHKQYEYVYKIQSEDRKAGDLVFFSRGSQIFHVGIYIGDNRMIHASASSGVTEQSLLDPYFANRYAGCGRIPALQ